MAAVNKLVLYPMDADFQLQVWDSLQQYLLSEQFIGDPLPPRKRAYRGGERLLQSIIFMGCSPSLVFEPPEDGSLDFCHVVFSNLETPLMFRHHSQGLIPCCPHCGHRVDRGMERIQSYLQGDTAPFQCESCSQTVSAAQLRWRHRGALARVFIDIYSVYPQEAVPTEQFLTQLKQYSGVEWSYCYTDQ